MSKILNKVQDPEYSAYRLMFYFQTLLSSNECMLTNNDEHENES